MPIRETGRLFEFILEYAGEDAKKRCWFGVETSAMFSADAAVTVNAVFDYDIAKYFSMGLGVGVTSQWDVFSYAGTQFGRAFLRFKNKHKRF